jgi:hypothetical protein
MAEVYSKDTGWKVRGITRSLDKAKAWEDQGVEILRVI